MADPCSKGCDRPSHAYQLCRRCYSRAAYDSDPTVPWQEGRWIDCGRCGLRAIHRAKGLCGRCYIAWYGKRTAAKTDAIWDEFLADGAEEWTDQHRRGSGR